jgi:phosphatidylglycerol:prolipoprotein diacylglycerol transferase
VLTPRRRHHGEIFAGLLIGYGLLRGVVEVFRDDDRGVLFGWLSTSQIISLPLIALGVTLLVLRQRLPVRTEPL